MIILIIAELKVTDLVYFDPLGLKMNSILKDFGWDLEPLLHHLLMFNSWASCQEERQSSGQLRVMKLIKQNYFHFLKKNSIMFSFCNLHFVILSHPLRLTSPLCSNDFTPTFLVLLFTLSSLKPHHDHELDLWSLSPLCTLWLNFLMWLSAQFLPFGKIPVRGCTVDMERSHKWVRLYLHTKENKRELNSLEF